MKYNRFGLWLTPKEWLGDHWESRRIISAVIYGYYLSVWFYSKEFPFVFGRITKYPAGANRMKFRICHFFVWSNMTREEADRLQADWEQGDHVVVNAQGLVTHIPASSHRDCPCNNSDEPIFHNPLG
jgi:hypothetical protein